MTSAKAYMLANIAAAGIEGNSRGPMFPAAIGSTGQSPTAALLHLCNLHNPPSCIRRQIQKTAIECPIPSVPLGITDYLTNGGKLQVTQPIAGPANAKTIGFYDGRINGIGKSEVKREGINSVFIKKMLDNS